MDMDMQPNSDENSSIFDALFGRLSSRGLMPVEILRLIKDVYSIIGEGGYFTVDSVNRCLNRLGWSENAMDIITFELIVSLLENGDDHRVERHTLH
jgi:hypothetical protein